MKNRSRVSRAALAAMLAAMLAVSAMPAQAALVKAPLDPIHRVGEGWMSRAWSGGVRLLASARSATGSLMIKLWDVYDYNPVIYLRLRGDR